MKVRFIENLVCIEDEIKDCLGEAIFERKLVENFPELKRDESLDEKYISNFK